MGLPSEAVTFSCRLFTNVTQGCSHNEVLAALGGPVAPGSVNKYRGSLDDFPQAWGWAALATHISCLQCQPPPAEAGWAVRTQPGVTPAADSMSREPGAAAPH